MPVAPAFALSLDRIRGSALIAAASAPALAKGGMNLRNAQVEPLSFAALDGWADDDHGAAFDTFLKSCSAILNGTKAMRAARPVFGALFKVCERAVSAGSLDRGHARAFFEENFKPVRVIAGRPDRRLLHWLLRNRGRWLAKSRPTNSRCHSTPRRQRQ